MINFGRCFILMTLIVLQFSSPCYAGKPKKDGLNEEGKRERKKTVVVKEQKEHKKSKVASSAATSLTGAPPTPKSNSQPQGPHDLPQDLLSKTTKSPVVREGTLEVWGEKLEELIKLSTEGNAEAAGKIGVTCYALSRFNLSTYDTQAPPFDDEGSDLRSFSDLAFKWLSHAHEKGCHSFNIELGYCHLFGLGVVIEDSFEAIKLFKTVTRDTRYYDPVRAFKRRLLLADSGFDRFIVLDEKNDKDFIAFLEKASSENNNLNAQCLLANRMLSTKKAKEGLETLTTLASKENNALAQWLLARAAFNGTGVKMNFQLGIKWAFTAAKRGCAKAMLFMNESFPSKIKGKVSDHNFSRTLAKMNKWHSTFSGSLYYFDNSFISLDKTSIASTFNKELSSLLEALDSTTHGLWISCLTAKDSIKLTLDNEQHPSFIYQRDGTLTWGKPNVIFAKKFEAFLLVCDQKFGEVYQVIDTEISKTEEQEKVAKEEGEKAENWNLKHTHLQDAKRLLRKINKMKEARTHLELLLTALKNLKTSTQEDRNNAFLLHHPFLNRIE